MKRETIKTTLVAGATLAVALLPVVVLAQGIFSPVNPFGGGPVITGSSVLSIIRSVVNWIMSVSVILGVAFFVYGGIRYAMAGGNDDAMKKAKTTMIRAVIGIALILGVGLIVNSIAALIQRGGQIG